MINTKKLSSLEKLSSVEKTEIPKEKSASSFDFDSFDHRDTRISIARVLKNYTSSDSSKKHLFQSLNEASRFDNVDTFTERDLKLWKGAMQNALDKKFITVRDFSQLPQIIKSVVKAAKAVYALPIAKKLPSPKHSTEKYTSPLAFFSFDQRFTQISVAQVLEKYTYSDNSEIYLLQSLNEASRYDNVDIFTEKDLKLWSDVLQNALRKNFITVRDFSQLPQIVKSTVEAAKAVDALPIKK